MSVNANHVRQFIQQFDLAKLFVEELGWDRHAVALDVPVDGQTYQLTALAHKRGLVAFRCNPNSEGACPDYATRRRIDRIVAKTHFEHLIIFTDAAKSTQVWQWVKREHGRPAASREHVWHKSQPGDALIQKLNAIVFTLDEEESITGLEVSGRVRAGFDVERITKRFYERFQAEHSAFSKFIKGIPDEELHRWYVSVMLNRLMFIYFIQKKGFLNGDPAYLRTKLAQSRLAGKDRFYSDFLCPLFFEGFATKETERSDKSNALLGKVPYLNGGLFLRHQIEELHGERIHIADAAFDGIFTFFDAYQWHLDERPLRKDDEINPDVLGYIFEKYINQKLMGAYYTKEDITDYIAKNCIIPFLFAAAAKLRPSAFAANGPVWSLLRDDPNRYIYPAVLFGVIDAGGKVILLPAEIEAGVSDVSKRGGWNRSAPHPFALPTETWREHVARRERCLELRRKLAAGEVASINDLITLNLNIRQFAQDVIDNCDDAELLAAFYQVLEKLTILDPTCGSGAFLFAGLNILEPLYESCLHRMEAFVRDGSQPGRPVKSARIAEFKQTLERIDRHPGHRYFILKSIIVNNLYGVDIMEEAVEICKLRLFLKLVAQVEKVEQIEPLPDIDFNIRAGNTLVGYASFDQAKKAIEFGSLDFQGNAAHISAKAAAVDVLFQNFRAQQLDNGPAPSSEASRQFKRDLLKLLDELRGELDQYLATESGHIGAKKLQQFRRSHLPFHWLVEFFGTMKAGGFDVIIGNPPYAEIPKELSRSLLQSYFRTALNRWSRDEDLYTLVVERALSLLRRSSGRFGMILPLSLAFSTKKPYVILRNVVDDEAGTWWWSHFDRIPSALFGNDVRTRCTIAILSRGASARLHATTPLLRWTNERRETLFPLFSYATISVRIAEGIPKVATQIQADALALLVNMSRPLGENLHMPVSFTTLVETAPRFPQPCVYIGGTAYNWFPAWRDIPETTTAAGQASLPARTAGYRLSSEEEADCIFALLCSSMGYWWWAVASDGFNLKKWLLERFPLSLSVFTGTDRRELARLGAGLWRELRKHYVYKDNKGRIGNYFLPDCSAQVRKIDGFLAKSVCGLNEAFFADIAEFNTMFSRAEATPDEMTVDED